MVSPLTAEESLKDSNKKSSISPTTDNTNDQDSLPSSAFSPDAASENEKMDIHDGDSISPLTDFTNKRSSDEQKSHKQHNIIRQNHEERSKNKLRGMLGESFILDQQQQKQHQGKKKDVDVVMRGSRENSKQELIELAHSKQAREQRTITKLRDMLGQDVVPLSNIRPSKESLNNNKKLRHMLGQNFVPTEEVHQSTEEEIHQSSSINCINNQKEEEEEEKKEILDPITATPCEKLKGIFTLDPTNNICADCSKVLTTTSSSLTMFDLKRNRRNSSDLIYISFQRPYNSKCRSSSSTANTTTVSTRNPLVPTDKFTIRPTTFFSRNDFGVQHVKCMPMSSISSSSRDHTLSFSVFICQDCAAIHRKILGNRNHNKQYYGLKCVQDKNEIWTESEVKYLSHNRGNKYADSILERYMPKEFKHRIRWDSPSLNIADMDSEKEVFIRAKYQTLSFLFPYGPLNPYHTLKSISNGNKRKDTWLIHPGVSNNDATNNNKKQKKKHSMVPPKRLVDFFCVLGSKDTTEQSIEKLKREDNDKSSPKTKKNWEDVEFDTQILDCYPPKNHYDDMDFPEHVSKFVFPDGCKLSRTWEKPSFFTFVLTLETGMRLYGASLRIYDTFLSLGDEDEVVYYVPKVLAVLSHYPFFDTYQKFLKLIYKVSRTPSSPLPIERFVVHFCREVPLPPPGRVEIVIRYDNLHPLKLRRPPKNQLPLVNFSYRALFASLSISNILVIFGLMLEESRIVICSEYYSLLTPVCEALLSLLFPFSWRGPYIPVMPVSMIDVLDAPFPFLIGLHSSVLYSGNLEDKPGVVFVDLDRDKIILGYEEKNFQMYNRQTPALPAKDALKLKSSLEEHGCSKVYIDTITKQKGLVVHNIGGNGKKQMFVPNSERDSYAYGVERESAFVISDFSSPQLVKRKTSSSSSTSPASSPPCDSNKNTTNAISKKRQEMFGLAESAFDEFERMDLKSFAAEVGTLVESEHGTSPTVNNVKPKKKKLSKYIPSTSSSSSSNNDKKDSDNNMKCNILDPKYDEDSSFSAIGVRQSFLRFFVSVFKNYSKFIITQDENTDHNRRFRDESFLNDLGYFGRTRNHISRLLESQMFERFIEERIENPLASEFLFFDESILAKLNRSIMSTTYTTTTSNLLHSKGLMPAVKLTKKNITPFLDDQSDNHTSVYTPPPPSYWGLPDDVTYSYREFPILNSELFGKIRTPTVNWPESNNNSHSSTSNDKKPNQTRKSVNVMDPKLLMRQTKAMSLIFGAEDPDIMKSSLAANKVMESVVKLPESPQLRNVEWAIHALAYKTTTTTNTTSSLNNNTNNKMKSSTKKSSSLSHPPNQISVRPIPKDLLTSAHCITLQAQNQQTILLWIIIRIQSIYRMHYTQNSYQTILTYIRKIQRNWRQHKICKTHGRVLNYYLECVKTIQAFWRRSLALDRFKSTVNAIQLLQRQARCWQTRNFFLNAKKAAILAQSIQRSRRCRFGFLFLKFKVTKVQSAIRGHLCRKHVQKFISQRIQDYRKQIVLLWKKAHVSLEYRSHFWVLFGGDQSLDDDDEGGSRQQTQTTHHYHQTFMNLGIHEDELRRLWDAVGFKDADPDIPTEVVHYSSVGEAKSFDGVCSEFKQHFLWVQTKLMEEEEKKDLQGKDKNNKSYPSSLISGSIHNNRRSTNTSDVETSHYSVGNENDRWIAMMTMNPRVVSLERLRIYEKLNKSSETTKRTHYAKMDIAVKDKKKKQNLAQDLWLDYEKADESANIVINIMNAIHQERSLKANKTPSRRRLKRFGLLRKSSGSHHTTEIASSVFTNNTNNYLTSGYDQWIKEKIDKRIRYNLKTTVHALLLGVQNLSVIVKQANLGGEVKNNKYESEAFQRQQKALFGKNNTSEEEGSEQCQFIEKYVNGFSQ